MREKKRGGRGEGSKGGSNRVDGEEREEAGEERGERRGLGGGERRRKGGKRHFLEPNSTRQQHVV